jgi:hypothetical protein
LIAVTELLKLQKSGQFPDEPVRIKVGQIHYVTGLTGINYPLPLPLIGLYHNKISQQDLLQREPSGVRAIRNDS